MRKKSRSRAVFVEGDLTPMIDMTFQLIAFFMVLVNFTDAAQDQRIHLPVGELAKPPDSALPNSIMLQLTLSGTVLFSGDELSLPSLEPYLAREAMFLSRRAELGLASVTVIIRADAAAEAGQVQRLIQMCQAVGLRKFALRALTNKDD